MELIKLMIFLINLKYLDMTQQLYIRLQAKYQVASRTKNFKIENSHNHNLMKIL